MNEDLCHRRDSTTDSMARTGAPRSRLVRTYILHDTKSKETRASESSQHGQVPCRFADLVSEIDHVDVCMTNIWQENGYSER